ncbi:hypothetical protein SmJEL517_g04240 [Synchytrium microbalum]|uniref:UspA domain-containing protein n=1 Tax=Synchytrium microbalum TaxID=1806994 RepID=A0A507C595_9FUNG|nr:uncharacterized protein SmJEL517_g04240 [Synchytrium microbalum]TPX32713.1 hypothetical protein SmJEL517_g04240 [Synchytrium microbalum]
MATTASTPAVATTAAPAAATDAAPAPAASGDHEVAQHTKEDHVITRTVVIALDSSPFSDHAFNWACEVNLLFETVNIGASFGHVAHILYSKQNFVKSDSDLVVLISVRSVATVPGPYGAAYMDFTGIPNTYASNIESEYLTQMEEANRAASHALLQQYGAKLKKSNIACKAIAMRGDPRDEITRKVQELNADVLVVGSRGLGAIKRTFLGSVSDYLVHHVVLVVRDREDQAQPPTQSAAVPVPVPAASK